MLSSKDNYFLKARKKHDTNFDAFNKDYYKYVEDYDWITATKQVFAPESVYHRVRERKALSYLQPYINSYLKVLDAGCGTGLILRHFLNQAIGIDINPRHVLKARKNAPNARVYNKDLEKTDFKNSFFDLIICFETLEHLLFPEKAINEFHRLLKPSGMFIGSVPRKTLLWKLRAISFTHPHNEPFHHEFSHKEITDLLTPKYRKLTINKEIFGLNYFFICQKK